MQQTKNNKSTTDDIIINLGSSAFAAAEWAASQTLIGGDNSVPSNNSLWDDQMTGHLCELALYRYWYGSPVPDNWILSRYLQNINRLRGDGGSDFVGGNVDVKGSRMRGGLSLCDYHLLVRQRQSSSAWYVLALLDWDKRVVHLMGWLPDGELPDQPSQDGDIFPGAYCVPANRLYRLPPMHWELTRNFGSN